MVETGDIGVIVDVEGLDSLVVRFDSVGSLVCNMTDVRLHKGGPPKGAEEPGEHESMPSAGTYRQVRDDLPPECQ